MASFGLGGGGPSAPQTPAADIDASTPFLAASEGNLPLLQQALQQLNIPSPLTLRDDNGYTLLMAVASYNHLIILDWLWSHIPSAATPEQVLQFLLEADQEGDSVLHYAGSAETAAWILGRYENTAPLLLAATNKQGQTPLQAKRDELNEAMRDEDVEDDDEDLETLMELVEFLSQEQC